MTAGLALPRLCSTQRDFPQRFESLLAAAAKTDPEVEAAARGIIAAVRRGGEAAVLEYTRRFDGTAADALADLRVPAAALGTAWEAIGTRERAALAEAASRIRDYHRRQRQESWHARAASRRRRPRRRGSRRRRRRWSAPAGSRPWSGASRRS